MSSLLLKDIIMLKSYAKTLLIMIAFFTLITFANDDTSYLSGMIILLLSMLPIASFSYDQQAKWDVFSQTLPVSRKQLVYSKYLLGLITVGGGIFFVLLLNVLVLFYKEQAINVVEIIRTNVAIAFVGMLFLSLLIPLIYQFGVEKSRLISLTVLAVPTLLGMGLSKLGVSLSWLDSVEPNSLLVISGLAVALVFVLSAFISVRIYSKKEF